MGNIPDTACGKMFSARFHQIKEKTSGKFSRKYAGSDTQRLMSLSLKSEVHLPSGQKPGKSWAMGSLLHGESSTLDIGECPKEENESFLSQIIIPNVPEKYCLSRKACLHILRTASARGKELPPILKAALESQAQRDSVLRDRQEHGE